MDYKLDITIQLYFYIIIHL